MPAGLDAGPGIVSSVGYFLRWSWLHNRALCADGQDAVSPFGAETDYRVCMGEMMRRVLVLLLLGLLAGCSQSVDIALQDEVVVYLSSDAAKQVRLTRQDEAYRELSDWLRDNQSNWYATSGRYPGGVYVKSGDHGIQVTERNVILYSTVGAEPRAMYIQDVSQSKLRGLKGLGTQASNDPGQQGG